MKQDRFLTGILIFIGVLVVAALGLFLVRSRAPAYGPEDTPQGVVHNYVAALQLKDYARAYSYLANEADKPTIDAFQQMFLDNLAYPSNPDLQIGETRMLNNSVAWVSVTIQNSGGGLFDQGYASADKAILVKQEGAWKIVSMPYQFWGYGWYTPTPPPIKTP